MPKSLPPVTTIIIEDARDTGGSLVPVTVDEDSVTTRVMAREAGVASRVMGVMAECDKMLDVLGRDGATLVGPQVRGALVRQVLTCRSLLHDIERALGASPPPLPASGVKKA